MKSNKMHKDKELRGRTFQLSGDEYHRGSHGEIKSKTPKLHLSKKKRRQLTAKAREQAAKAGEV